MVSDVQSWGITPSGFVCPTEEQVLNEKIKRAKELLGENVSTDETTILGKLLRIEAKDDHRLYEQIEQIYYNSSPATATGVSLDRAMSFAFVKRNAPTYAVHNVRFYGKTGYSVPIGTLVRNVAGVKFYTLREAIIGGEGGDLVEHNQQGGDIYYTDVSVQCTETGKIGNVRDIDRMVMVNTNITSVKWLSITVEGKATESDPDARKRYRQIVDGLGTNTKASIIANVLKINGMVDCDIVENRSDTNPIVVSAEEPMLTVEPETYGVITYGSAKDEDVAKAIFEKRPFGIRQSGSTSVDITDDSGTVQTTKFTKVAVKTVNISYTVATDESFAQDGITQIESKIREHTDTLTIGDVLVFTQLYACIYSVEGVKVVTELKVNGNTTDVKATRTQIIRCGTVTGNNEVTNG